MGNRQETLATHLPLKILSTRFVPPPLLPSPNICVKWLNAKTKAEQNVHKNHADCNWVQGGRGDGGGGGEIKPIATP